ncbi:MAG TPA: FtsX-like permease family protein [Gaiellales bacterium]|nr:FtsX-like permease family protein [Gaiellales bacterium]
MIGLALRGLLSRKLRSVLTSVAIVLGVAMAVGTLIVSDQITSAFSNIFGTALRGTDVILSAKPPFPGGPAGPVPARLIATVRALPGVAKAEGQVQAVGSVVLGGKVVSAVGGAPNLVLSTLPRPFSQSTLTAGRFPAASGEVAVNSAMARDHHLRVGQRLGLSTPTGLHRVTLVGIFDFGNVSSLGGATLTATTFADAQRWWQLRGRTTVIVVSAEPGVTPAALARRISRAVPGNVKVQTGAQAAQASTDALAGAINGVLTPLLLAFAAVAGFVGASIIFNTYSITVAQRTREFAMLRTIGATRRQVLGSVLGEAAIVGAAASLVGLAVGVGFAKGLNALFSAFGFGLPLSGVVLGVDSVVWPVAAGVSVTLVSSLIPAVRATRVAPVAALREGATLPPTRLSRAVPYLSPVVMASGGLLVAQGVFGSGSTTAHLSLLGLGSLLVFIATAMLSRYLIRPLTRVIAWPMTRLAPAAGRLARDNAMRSPGRTAVTAAALMIGVGVVVFVSVFVNGFEQTFLGALDRSVSANLIIQSSGGQQPVAAGVTTAAAASPGVSTASGIEAEQARIGRGGTDVMNGVSPATIGAVYRFDWLNSGSDALLARLGPDAALVEQQFAESHGLSVGDTFQVTGSSGARATLHDVGEYNDPVLLGGFTVSDRTFARLSDTPRPRVVLVRFAPDADPRAAERAVTAAMRTNYPDAQVQTTAQYKATVSAGIQQLLNFLYVLLAMIVIVSVFGIVNTLALSVFERTREIGMLRAIGATRRQVRRMIRWESVIVAVIGGLLGIVLGIALARVVALGLSSQGIVFAIPVGQVIASLLVAIVVGVLAAVLPARRAGRLDVLEALQYE